MAEDRSINQIVDNTFQEWIIAVSRTQNFPTHQKVKEV